MDSYCRPRVKDLRGGGGGGGKSQCACVTVHEYVARCSCKMGFSLVAAGVTAACMSVSIVATVHVQWLCVEFETGKSRASHGALHGQTAADSVVGQRGLGVRACHESRRIGAQSSRRAAEQRRITSDMQSPSDDDQTIDRTCTDAASIAAV